MPINHDMMHAQSNDEVATLKARIAELERMDTEHTVQIAKMNAYIRKLEEAQRWRKYPEEKPNVKPGEAEDFLVVVDRYNTYDSNPRGRYVTEAEYYVDETGCFYRACTGQEIDETFNGKNGEECYEKVIMWREMPKAPEVK